MQKTSSSRKLFLRRFARPAVAALLGVLLTASSLFAGGPPMLKSSLIGPVSFHVEKDTSSMQLWRNLGKTHGFDVVFDAKTRDLDVQLDLSAATVGDSLDRLALATDQFWVALDHDSILVADDTPQNRREYEPQVVRTFHLENAELKGAMTALRSIYGTKHIVADEDRRSLTIRDSDAKARLVEALLAELDVPADEVTLDVQLGAGSNEALVEAQLGTVGGARAGVAIKERHPGSGNLLTVKVEVETQVHPSAGEVTLDVTADVVEIDKSTEAAQLKGELSPESQTIESSWRVAAGEPLVIELPGAQGSDEKLTLTLTPTIKKASPSGARQALWVGSESNVQGPKVAKSKLTEDEKDVIRDRLRARLKNLPRPAADEDGPSKRLSEAEQAEIRAKLRQRLMENKVQVTEEEKAEEE